MEKVLPQIEHMKKKYLAGQLWGSMMENENEYVMDVSNSPYIDVTWIEHQRRDLYRCICLPLRVENCL